MLTESSCVFARTAPRAAKDKLGPHPCHTSPCRKVSSSEIPPQPTSSSYRSFRGQDLKRKNYEIRSSFASTLTRSIFLKEGLKSNNHQVGLNPFQGLGCQPELLFSTHWLFHVLLFSGMICDIVAFLVSTKAKFCAATVMPVSSRVPALRPFASTPRFIAPFIVFYKPRLPVQQPVACYFFPTSKPSPAVACILKRFDGKRACRLCNYSNTAF